MKRPVFIFSVILFLVNINFLPGQQFVANYDESKVPAYKLPDPLKFENGRTVSNKSSWKKRREEILSIFEKEIYGIAPEWYGEIKASELSSDENALNGKAVRKEINLTLKNGSRELTMTMLLYMPKKPGGVPVFLGYNFYGNHTLTSDPAIAVPESWIRNNKDYGVFENRASEAGRGLASSSWPVDMIVSGGYGVATIYYGDADPDYDDGFRNGVHGLYDGERDDSSWGTIAAWAWGLSRAMDYLLTLPSVDPAKVIVMGHSRLGKTALWAGAVDERFALVISNNSGCGGAALSKRAFGETVGSINRSFPHWFCSNFNKYNEREELLPVDQHQLIALIAPRPVYVASAEEDQWADPRGEFLSCRGASPVYKLLTGEEFPAVDMPPVNSPVVSRIGYHIRTGVHAVTEYDWQQYLRFADLHLQKK